MQREQRDEELPSLNAREVLQTSLFYKVSLDINILSFLLFLFADMDSILLNLCHHGNSCIIKVRINFKSNHPLQSLLATWQKTYGLKLVDSDRFHANVGIASNFCNGVKIKFIVQEHCIKFSVGLQFSRIIWGLLFDKIGYKRSTLIIGVCVCIGVSVLPLLQFLGNKHFIPSGTENISLLCVVTNLI